MLPAAWARSQPTGAPAAWPAAVSRSIGWAWPVAKLTPARKTSAISPAPSAMAASRSSVRTVDSPVRGPTTTRSRSGSRPRAGQVGRQRVAIRREERAVGQDPASPPVRPEERGEQEMEVHGQAVEQGDLGRERAHDARHRLAHRLIEREPRPSRLEPGVHAEVGPGDQLPLDGRPGRARLEPERLAREVDGRWIRRAPSGGGTGRGVTSAGRLRRAPGRPPRPARWPRIRAPGSSWADLRWWAGASGG